MSSKEQNFTRENQIIQQNESILGNLKDTPAQNVVQNYQALLQEYKKLLKSTQKLIKLSDKSNHKLYNKNLYLETDNDRLQDFLERTQNIAEIGGWEIDLENKASSWTKKTSAIFALKEVPNSILQMRKLFYKMDFRNLLSLGKQCIYQGIASEIEIQIVNSHNKQKWIRIQLQPFYPQKPSYKIHGYVQDITARKISEITRNKFLNNLSHELRTPLNTIMGFSEELKSTLQEEEQQHITRIHSTASHLLEIINDILELTRIENDEKPDLIKQEFSLKTLLQETVTPFLEQMEFAGLTTKLHVSQENLPQTVIGDDSKLRQILVNLLSNAMKFTTQGKIHVLVTAKNSQNNKIMLFVQVSDTGIGVKEELYETIFQSFFQEDGSLTRNYRGTGVGLNLAKQYCLFMNGDIGVRSPSQLWPKGSDFWFEVELEIGKKNPQSTSSKANTLNDKNKKLEILIVEDDVLNQQLLRTFLKKLEANLTFANDGQEGVLSSQKKKYDIILMDIQMPHMDGYEATRLIRKIDTQTPIIAVSANAFPEDIKKAIDVGMNLHIAKPVSKKHLLDTISQYTS
ncbi:MAG: response regulator [Spirochaetota bacterium]